MNIRFVSSDDSSTAAEILMSTYTMITVINWSLS